MILNIAWKTEGRSRRPDLPEGASFRVVRDRGETVDVEVDASALPRTDRADIARRLHPSEAAKLRRRMRELDRAAEQDDDGDAAKLLLLWEASSSIPHHAPEWPVLVGEMEGLFGEARAAELLAPSE